MDEIQSITVKENDNKEPISIFVDPFVLRNLAIKIEATTKKYTFKVKTTLARIFEDLNVVSLLPRSNYLDNHWGCRDNKILLENLKNEKIGEKI